MVYPRFDDLFLQWASTDYGYKALKGSIIVGHLWRSGDGMWWIKIGSRPICYARSLDEAQIKFVHLYRNELP